MKTCFKTQDVDDLNHLFDSDYYLIRRYGNYFVISDSDRNPPVDVELVEDSRDVISYVKYDHFTCRDLMFKYSTLV